MFLKTILKAQNTLFSRLKQVTNKLPKTFKTKFWKICLSVFCDWKVHPWGSRKGSRGTIWVTSRLELPLANKSPTWVRKIPKTQIFEIFLSLFRDWDFDQLESRENLLSKFATGGSWLDWLARQVAKTRLHSFWKFWNFSKQKYYPKTIRTLKNLFVYNQHIIEHVQHI